MLGNVMEWTLDQYAPYTAAPAENPWVEVDRALSSCRPRRLVERSTETRVACTVRVPSDASWKKQDPQLPKSIWYMTDAQWLGFRLVRPATLPTSKRCIAPGTTASNMDPF